MSAINWTLIGEQTFNILDPQFGFWVQKGFVRDQEKAKSYKQSDLTIEEKNLIDSTRCTLMSA